MEVAQLALKSLLLKIKKFKKRRNKMAFTFQLKAIYFNSLKHVKCQCVTQKQVTDFLF